MPEVGRGWENKGDGTIFNKGVSLTLIQTSPRQCYLSECLVCVCVYVCVCVCVCVCVTPFLSVLFVFHVNN